MRNQCNTFRPKMDDIEINLKYDLERFANAVNYYLSYIELVAVPDTDKSKDSRPHFITESAVRFPLAEFLERRLKVSDLELEYIYPYLNAKRCDFKFTISYNGGKSNQTCLAEVKYIKSSISIQDYFDDLMRLYFARREIKDVQHVFFIVCGKRDDFISFLDRSIIKNMNKREPANAINIITRNQKDIIFNQHFQQLEEQRSILNASRNNKLRNAWLSSQSDTPLSMTINNDYWDAFASSHFYKTDKETKQSVPIREDVPSKPKSITTTRICIAGWNTQSEHNVGIWEIS